MTLKRIMVVFVMAALGVLLATEIVTAQDQPPPGGNGEAPPLQGAQDTGQQPLVPSTPVPTTASGSVSALGSVEPNTVASLQFQMAGTIKNVYVQVGDYVDAGEVLADLKDEDVWNSYNQAVLNLESATLAMDDLMQPATEDELAVAKANIASAQAGYSSTANSVTDAQLTSAQLKYDQAQNQLSALQDARAHMNGTDAEITLAEAQIGAASFNAEIARLQLEELQTPDNSSLWSAGIRIQQAQLSLEQLEAPPSQSEIDSAQLAIDRAQATVVDAQNSVKKVQLIAPISGYVTTLDIAADQSIAAGTTALQLSDMSSLHMTVPVNELDISKILEGMNATIQLDALTDLTIPGTVEHVGWISSTSSDGIVTYDVQVVLNTDDFRVRIGMTGEVTIETESTSS